jgi:hypothetical protein
MSLNWLVMVMSPPRNKPEELISPVVIVLLAVRLREPPFPSLEEEFSSPRVVSMPPALLVRAIFPPLPVP